MLLFRHKLLQELLRLEKIYPATLEILDRFRHTGFSVYQSPPVLPCDTAAREKLAVYILHPPISLDRMSYDSSNGMIDYRPKSSQEHASLPGTAHRQDPLETLAALTDHIPNARHQLIRYLGWYSNKSRGLRKKAAVAPAAAAGNGVSTPFTEPLPDSDDTAFRKSCRRTWAQLIQKVYLVSPLVCPKCRFPMKIISFIEDPPVIRRILQHLGVWSTQERPPPIISPTSFTVEPIPDVWLPWAAETILFYEDVDPTYED
jgi:hypothetical protein